jgi:hypothetical protein
MAPGAAGKPKRKRARKARTAAALDASSSSSSSSDSSDSEPEPAPAPAAAAPMDVDSDSDSDASSSSTSSSSSSSSSAASASSSRAPGPSLLQPAAGASSSVPAFSQRPRAFSPSPTPSLDGFSDDELKPRRAGRTRLPDLPPPELPASVAATAAAAPRRTREEERAKREARRLEDEARQEAEREQRAKAFRGFWMEMVAEDFGEELDKMRKVSAARRVRAAHVQRLPPADVRPPLACLSAPLLTLASSLARTSTGRQLGERPAAAAHRCARLRRRALRVAQCRRRPHWRGTLWRLRRGQRADRRRRRRDQPGDGRSMTISRFGTGYKARAHVI